MKTFTTRHAAAALCATLALASVAAQAHDGRQTSAVGTAVSNVAATIAQVNYDEQGVVNGFIVGSSTLLNFGKRICGGVTTLGAVGHAISYSGTSYSNTVSGYATVRVSSLTNTTTAVTYTAPTTTTPTAYPATAGSLTRLNFDESGGINGFLFTPTGSSTAVLVKLGNVSRNTTLTAALQVGASVSVTGTTLATETSCLPVAVSTVRATSLTVGGTTYTIGGRGY